MNIVKIDENKIYCINKYNCLFFSVFENDKKLREFLKRWEFDEHSKILEIDNDDLYFDFVQSIPDTNKWVYLEFYDFNLHIEKDEKYKYELINVK